MKTGVVVLETEFVCSEFDLDDGSRRVSIHTYRIEVRQNGRITPSNHKALPWTYLGLKLSTRIVYP